MTWTKFARDRHKPDGKWVQATAVEKVAGVIFRYADAKTFADEAKTAELKGRRYGVDLRPEPGNPVDPQAIAVVGWVTAKGWVSGERRKEWHIGYVAAETAANLHRAILSQGQPIAGEIYAIFESGDFLDFSIIVLAPPGFSQSSLASQAAEPGSADDIRSRVSVLVKAGNADAAISLLLDACDEQEAGSIRSGHGVAPWCYEDLAKLFRKLKLREEEIAILRRYDAQQKAPGVSPARLRERLDKLLRKMQRASG